MQLALAELAEWAFIEAKAAPSKAEQKAWQQVRDWAVGGGRSAKVAKQKTPLPPDTDILEALEARLPGIIATGARWSKANAFDEATKPAPVGSD